MHSHAEQRSDLLGQQRVPALDPNSPEGAVAVTLAEGLVGVDLISLGYVHACLIVTDQVECWGLNDRFVLGSTIAQPVSFDDRIVVDVADSSALALGRESCALGDDNVLRCWGGDTANVYTLFDAAGAPLPAIRSVALSNSRTLGCVAAADGRAMCWGENGSGQLGNVAATEAMLPHAVVVTDEGGDALSGVEQVAVGYEHACARTSEGAVLCWGRRDRLGNGGSGTVAQRHATAVLGIDDAIDVVAGTYHTCVRRRSGQVQCWGDNASGQVGVSNVAGAGYSSLHEPVDVLGLP
jgi:hypothetical protein